MAANYGKNLFNQLEEMFEKVDFLMDENKKLKSEIKTLRNDHRAEIVALKAEHKKEINLLKEDHKIEVDMLNGRIDTLERENKKIKTQLNKDSSNSSKPPSSDGFKKKIHNSREKTGKKPGGQKGHIGKTVKLFDEPTEVINHNIKKCECGHIIQYGNDYERKQEVDIEFIVHIKEHRAGKGYCPGCDKVIINRLPQHLNNPVTYGNGIKSTSAMFTNEGLVSINRTGQMIYELTGGKISLADSTISNFNKELGKRVLPSIESIKDNLSKASVLHKDETTMGVGKEKRWLHFLGNKFFSYFIIDEKRGSEADDRMGILKDYSDFLVHDHLRSLYNFLCKHAECNQHVVRYLVSVMQNEEKYKNFAEEMLKLLIEMNDRKKELMAESNYKCEEPELKNFIERYEDILKRWLVVVEESKAIRKRKNKNRTKKDKEKNTEGELLAIRLNKYQKEHLRFMTNFEVPFTNNLAEQNLRMSKTKSKVSGCFRSEVGVEAYANTKSYLATLRKHGMNLFEGLKAAFSGNPVMF